MIKAVKRTLYQCADGKEFLTQHEAALYEARSCLGKFATTDECEICYAVIKTLSVDRLEKFSVVLREYIDGMEIG